MQIDISGLSDDQIHQRVAQAGFGSADEYICALIQNDLASIPSEDCLKGERFKQLVLEGLQAGPMTPLTDEERQTIRADLMARKPSAS